MNVAVTIIGRLGLARRCAGFEPGTDRLQLGLGQRPRPGFGRRHTMLGGARENPDAGHILGKGWNWVLGKLLVSAAGVCAIAYAIGTRPKESSADVSRGITLSVYWGTVFVLVVHFVTAFFEFDRPLG